jgi:hypothetical protein
VLIAVLIQSHAIEAKPCVTELLKNFRLFVDHDSAAQDQAALRPLGLNREDYTALLDRFMFDPAFIGAEAVVIYGSRTHFKVGYRPQINSDLDLAVFFTGGFGDAWFDRVDAVNRSLQPLSGSVGFSIEMQVPPVETFDEFLARLKVPEGEMQRVALVDRLAEEGRWSREQHRQAQLQARASTWFNEEAIFLVKNQNSFQNWKRLLQANGYRHIILLKDVRAKSL